jgi:hypothetical protein
MLRLKKYTGTEKADFYIQSHGDHAGRPLKEPIRNCFAIWTDTTYAFEICTCLYIARKYEYFIIGSCVPFVRLFEIKALLSNEFSKSYHKKSLQHLEKVMTLEKTFLAQCQHVKNLKIAYAKQITKTVK